MGTTCNSYHDTRKMHRARFVFVYALVLQSLLNVEIVQSLERKRVGKRIESGELLEYCAFGPDGEVLCDNESCLDSHDSCSFWFSAGECDNNPGYMQANCMKSCGICSSSKKKRERT